MQQLIGKRIRLIEMPQQYYGQLYYGLPNITLGRYYLITSIVLAKCWFIDDGGQLCSLPLRFFDVEQMGTSYTFFKHTEHGHLYRTLPIRFSYGGASLRLERWNREIECWNGHIHDHEKTRKLLQEGKVIVRISDEEAFAMIGEENAISRY